MASSERLCLPPLVLAAILSSQLRAGLRGERVVSGSGSPKVPDGGCRSLISSSAVRNRLGKTCCRNTFALSPFPGPQRSPKEGGGCSWCLLELLPSLLPACQAQQHALFTESGIILCPLPAVAAQGERSRVRNQSPGWQAGQVGTPRALPPPGTMDQHPPRAPSARSRITPLSYLPIQLSLPS